MERDHENGREEKWCLEGLGRKKGKGEILQLNYNLKNKNECQNFVVILWKIKINHRKTEFAMQIIFWENLGIHTFYFDYIYKYGYPWRSEGVRPWSWSYRWLPLLLPCYLSRKKQVELHRTQLSGVRWEMTNLEIVTWKSELHMGLSQSKVHFLNA